MKFKSFLPTAGFVQWQCLSLRKISDMAAKKISSGKSWIDTLLDGGYDRGKLYLVGGVGVNWLECFLRQSAVDICMDGSKGLLFSLEFSAESYRLSCFSLKK
jgi:KaiC/GvpD/RAD55 family RecA-like ATPase